MISRVYLVKSSLLALSDTFSQLFTSFCGLGGQSIGRSRPELGQTNDLKIGTGIHSFLLDARKHGGQCGEQAGKLTCTFE